MLDARVENARFYPLIKYIFPLGVPEPCEGILYNYVSRPYRDEHPRNLGQVSELMRILLRGRANKEYCERRVEFQFPYRFLPKADYIS